MELIQWAAWESQQVLTSLECREGFDDEGRASGAMDAPESIPAGGCCAGVVDPGTVWGMLYMREGWLR